MRKIGCMVLAILLMVSVSHATPRENTRAEGKTGFTNIAVVGNDITGVPGYIEFVHTGTSGTTLRWYVFVDSIGSLRIASSTQVGTTAAAGAPQLTDWGTAGTEVGSQ